jgi:hypothetical protein
LAGPSEIAPAEDVSEETPKHAEVRPLLPKLEGIVGGIVDEGESPMNGDAGNDAAFLTSTTAFPPIETPGV